MKKSQLIPDKHPNLDLFICDVADAVLKDIMPEMEHPFYSLSKKPQTAITKYEHNGKWIQITPSVKGQATIYDKDILIYCISQIMAKLNNDEQVSRRVKINTYDLLVFTNRGTGGRDYTAICDALDRLQGTMIATNITTDGQEQRKSFGLIEETLVKREHGKDGRLISVEVELSNWVFNAIRANEISTLHPEYFQLRKPIERRVYELARKHAHNKQRWEIGLEKLHKKSGSRGLLKSFRHTIKNLAEHNHLPDYEVQYIEEDKENKVKEKVVFHNRNTMKKVVGQDTSKFPYLLDLDTYEKARKAAPVYDPYYLQEKWIEFWFQSGKPKLFDPDEAFIAFCRKRYSMKPIP